MLAEYLEDGSIAVSGRTKSEKFNKIWAGIGWPDFEPGYVCVVGERADGRFHVLWEKRGGLWEVGDAAREAKDRFLIDRIVVDPRDELATSYLRTLDGLCFYEEDEDRSVRISGPQRSTRRYFRDTEALAVVVPVPERVSANYRSALEKTRGVIMAGRLLVHEPNCPVLTYTLRQPLEDLLRSPVMKGLVWVVTALEDARGLENGDTTEPDQWYANPPRDVR